MAYNRAILRKSYIVNFRKNYMFVLRNILIKGWKQHIVKNSATFKN